MAESPRGDPTQILRFLLLDSAPGTRGEIEVYLRENKTRLVIDRDDHNVLFVADSESQTIGMGIKCIPRLWALVCGCLRLYEAVSEQRERDASARQTEVDVDDWAVKILDWSILAEI